MKKLSFLTSMVALTFAVPAMAVPSNTSSTFPSNGIMEEDYTYQNQATVTNLKVSEGTATTTANYDNCPTAFPNSDEGATSTDECYTACTVSDFPANSHIASVTGKNYSGANVTDTCAIASCDTGYTLTNHIVYPQGTPDLMTLIGASEAGTTYAAISDFGEDMNSNASTYGLSTTNDHNKFVADYSDKGKITGHGRCSTRSVNNPWVGTNGAYVLQSDSAVSSLTNETGQTGARYCYCQLETYMPLNGTTQTISAPWVFHYDHIDEEGCRAGCAHGCADDLQNGSVYSLTFRAAVFGSLGNSVASCDANTIQITWADASAEDIAANDAGSVTYGGDIRTPKKAVHKPGKIFTGWTFNAQSGN